MGSQNTAVKQHHSTLPSSTKTFTTGSTSTGAWNQIEESTSRAIWIQMPRSSWRSALAKLTRPGTFAGRRTVHPAELLQETASPSTCSEPHARAPTLPPPWSTPLTPHPKPRPCSQPVHDRLQDCPEPPDFHARTSNIKNETWCQRSMAMIAWG